MEGWAQLGDLDEFAETLAEVPPPPASPLPGAEHVKGFFGDLAAIVRDPDEGLDAVVDRKPLCSAVTWIVLGVLVFALMSIHLEEAPAFTPLYVPAAGKLAAFGKALFLGIVCYLIWFGALMATVGPVLKGEADWKDGLVILGLSTIPTASIGFLMFLLFFIQSPIFTGFALGVLATVALPANVLLFYRTLLRTTKASRRSVLLAVPSIYLAASLVYGLLVLIMRP